MTENKIVLVCEDEKSLAKALQFNLGLKGYQVIIAFDGRQALANDSKADLILLDIAMPILNGAEFIRQRKSTCPIIIISNYPEDEAKAQFNLKNDYVAYFVKSDTPLQVIADKVEEVLGDGGI